ncbi:HAD family hydrolase [Patescibacteria group bacterium]
MRRSLTVLIQACNTIRQYCSDGKIFSECCSLLFPNSSPDEIATALDKNKKKLERALDLITPVSGLPEVLSDLRNEYGVRIAITTNRLRNDGLEKVLSRAELILGKNIDTVITAGGELRPKPAPDIFYRAMLELGVRKNSKQDRNSCLVVEDGVSGLVAVKGVLDTCAVLWGWANEEELNKQNPTYLIKNPEELKLIVLGEIR